MLDKIDTPVTVYRKINQTSNSDASTYTKIGTINIFLVPLSDEQLAITGGQTGKDFNAWAEVEADVKQSDKIRLDGDDYIVGGVRTWNFGGIPHKDLRLSYPNQ